MPKYRKRSTQYIIAVQINLEIEGFNYLKWGSLQQCKKGDWLVDNNGEVYTIDKESFSRTYRKISPGIYVKNTLIWAVKANESGTIKTKEGSTLYESGDYIVSNNEDGSDSYAIEAKKFEDMYELDEKN